MARGWLGHERCTESSGIDSPGRSVSSISVLGSVEVLPSSLVRAQDRRNVTASFTTRTGVISTAHPRSESGSTTRDTPKLQRAAHQEKPCRTVLPGSLGLAPPPTLTFSPPG